MMREVTETQILDALRQLEPHLRGEVLNFIVFLTHRVPLEHAPSHTQRLTAAVMAPAAVWGSRAGLEFLHPLAVTTLGGLVSLLLVQAFVLPAFLTVTAGQTAAPDAPPDVAPASEPQHIA